MEFIKIVVIYSWAKQKFGGQSAEDVVQDFFFFFCSICIWYNFKAWVPLTNKLKDKDKFMLQRLFKTKSTFTVASRLSCNIRLILFLFRFLFYAGVIKMSVVCGRV